MAGAKKKALREGRILVFIDESGLSQRPHRCRTWSPRGQTPILQYNFNWKSLVGSRWAHACGTSTFVSMPVRSRRSKCRIFCQPWCATWTGRYWWCGIALPAHRSRLVQDYIASLQGWIVTAYLPAYAPELNPVEYIWGYWKQHELPNVCPKDYGQLSEAARRTLRRMRRRPRLITAFWRQASLWPE